MTSYCSLSCQSTDWPSHKRGCRKQVTTGSLYGKQVEYDGSSATVARLNAAITRHETWAFARLGVLYAHGIGVPRDEARAVTLFRTGADLGGVVALSCLGQAELQGLGGNAPNPTSALFHFEAAAAKGCADGLFGTGVIYKRMGRIAAAAAAFEAAHIRGHSGGTLGLADLLMAGDGIPRDQARSEILLAKVASGTDSHALNAQNTLASIKTLFETRGYILLQVSSGERVRHDLRMATEEPHRMTPDLLFQLGIDVFHGVEGVGDYGVKPDRAGGLHIMRRAATTSAACAFHLSRLLCCNITWIGTLFISPASICDLKESDDWLASQLQQVTIVRSSARKRKVEMQ